MLPVAVRSLITALGRERARARARDEDGYEEQVEPEELEEIHARP